MQLSSAWHDFTDAPSLCFFEQRLGCSYCVVTPTWPLVDGGQTDEPAIFQSLLIKKKN